MKNRNIDEDDYSYDYSPNELAELSISNKKLYEEIVNSNLEEGDTIEQWQRRNMERVQSKF